MKSGLMIQELLESAAKSGNYHLDYESLLHQQAVLDYRPFILSREITEGCGRDALGSYDEALFPPTDGADFIEEKEWDLDLPFPNCSFESLEPNRPLFFLGLNSNSGGGEVTIDDLGDDLTISSIVINETGPQRVSFIAFLGATNPHTPTVLKTLPIMGWGMMRDGKFVSGGNFAPFKERSEAYELFKELQFDATVIIKAILTFVASFCDRIADYDCGSQRVKIRGRGKVNGKKVVKKIREVVHIRPKKSTEPMRLNTGGETDWSHRWEVRGHWRKIKTIGKDRQGIYGTKGYTWVSNHVRGPDHLEVVKKIRVHSPMSGEARA